MRPGVPVFTTENILGAPFPFRPLKEMRLGELFVSAPQRVYFYSVKNAILIFTVLLCGPILRAQEDTFRLTVLGYRWTTNHRTLTFSWPGYANTSCNGSVEINGYVSGGGNISASGTSSDTCSTTYRPPTTQNIDIQNAVVFIQAETESSRMLLTCTRNVRWSQCQSLKPGHFLGRNDNGHFEVRAFFGKGKKEKWIKFAVVQRTALSRQQPETPPAQEAAATIEAPQSETAGSNSGVPSRWKSMTSGTVRTLRFEGEYIYGEAVLTEAAAKAGAFGLMDVKKDGDKYFGKVNRHIVSQDGDRSCSVSSPIELTLVSPERIEGRIFTPPSNSKTDWTSCTFSPAADWQAITWIPVW